MNTLSIFDSLKQGILICDKSGSVVFCNSAYAEFIGVPFEELKGKAITDYRKGSVIPAVLKSREKIENILRKEKGVEYFASIYPILDEGKLFGTVSIVTTIDSVREQSEQVPLTLKDRVKEFERTEILKALSIYGSDLQGKKTAADKLGISLSSLYEKLNENR